MTKSTINDDDYTEVIGLDYGSIDLTSIAVAIKHDAGRPRFDLVPPDAELETAKVYAFGADKYADRNWEKGMNWGRVERALMSHLNKWRRGVKFDDESGLHELAHVIANAQFLLAYELRGIGTDTRPEVFKAAANSQTKDTAPDSPVSDDTATAMGFISITETPISEDEVKKKPKRQPVRKPRNANA